MKIGARSWGRSCLAGYEHRCSPPPAGHTLLPRSSSGASGRLALPACQRQPMLGSPSENAVPCRSSIQRSWPEARCPCASLCPCPCSGSAPSVEQQALRVLLYSSSSWLSFPIQQVTAGREPEQPRPSPNQERPHQQLADGSAASVREKSQVPRRGSWRLACCGLPSPVVLPSFASGPRAGPANSRTWTRR